jgi:hypothetical protein
LVLALREIQKPKNVEAMIDGHDDDIAPAGQAARLAAAGCTPAAVSANLDRQTTPSFLIEERNRRRSLGGRLCAQ